MNAIFQYSRSNCLKLMRVTWFSLDSIHVDNQVRFDLESAQQSSQSKQNILNQIIKVKDPQSSNRNHIFQNKADQIISLLHYVQSQNSFSIYNCVDKQSRARSRWDAKREGLSVESSLGNVVDAYHTNMVVTNSFGSLLKINTTNDSRRQCMILRKVSSV